MTSNNRNGTSSDINGDEICLLCGKSKQEKNLVCYSCYKLWQDEQIASVADKTKFVSIVEWTLKRAKTLTPVLEEDFLQAKTDLNNFKEKIKDQAYRNVRESLNGKPVEHGLFLEMLRARRQKLWKEGDGNKLFGRFKYLEFRISELPLLIKDLEEKVAAHDESQSMTETQDSEEAEE